MSDIVVLMKVVTAVPEDENIAIYATVEVSPDHTDMYLELRLDWADSPATMISKIKAGAIDVAELNEYTFDPLVDKVVLFGGPSLI